MNVANSTETIRYDVVIVGAGPSGLSAAIRLKQCNPEMRVCVLEKGSEVGAHILSGAVIETRALDELLPDWQEKGAPLHTKALEDRFMFLTKTKAIRLPTPKPMQNHGNYIISLGELCRWLAGQATELGVEIFAGFPARELVFSESGRVTAVRTGEFGRNKQGEKKEGYQPPMQIDAGFVLLAEGCRGSLTRELEARYGLRDGKQHQTYAIGIKEMWQIPKEKHHPGSIMHSIGWPLDPKTYGGSFLYHLGEDLVSIGFVIGLDYENPYLNPFKEFQRFKTHPEIRKMLEGGKRISYGARALNEGGYQSVPKVVFPGGALIGCSAGFVNVPKIKGTHTAMKSGMLAADAVADAIAGGKDSLESYTEMLQQSWVMQELHTVRNIRPAFRFGLIPGLVYAALDSYIFRGKAPWTFRHHHPDHESLKPKESVQPIAYPDPDGKVSFDLLSSVYLSSTNHEEDQPAHLTLRDAAIPVAHNLAIYDAPEQRYCPAGVYEIVREADQAPRLQINAQNCVHCKTCDIKDPTQNIVWVPPEGGGGPNYGTM